MKRTLLFASLCTLLLAVSAFAQDKAAQIADVKNQIATLENETPAMLKTLEGLKTEKEDKITFVSNAYDKAEANYEQESAAFVQKAQNLGRQYELLKPALDNYNQRVAAHNAHQCTETNHDGSCGWYTAEKNQLDNNQAQLQQAYAPLDAQKAQLQSEQANLAQTHEKLETIRTNLNSEIDSWKGRIAQLKADWDAHEAKMAQLEAKLAALYGDNQSCMAEVQRTPECDKPNAVGPDGKPLLNGKCEEMVARCRRMFDGSK
jgi:chromosome segregation ATPase